MIWREKKWLLIGLGVLLAANALFFLTYRVRYEQRVDDLDGRLEEARTGAQAAQQARVRAEKRLTAFRSTATAVDRVYNDWWSTPRQRLAPMIIELRRMAATSELIPEVRSYTYSQQSSADNPVVAQQMTITFTVSGTYQQVRRLINLIEMSDQFIIIDQVGLNEGRDNQRLNLSLRLRTLFREVDQKDLEALNI